MVVPALPTLLSRPTVSALVLQREIIGDKRPPGGAVLLDKLADRVVLLSTPDSPVGTACPRETKIRVARERWRLW